MIDIVQGHFSVISQLFLWLGGGTVCFLLFKRASDKRDDELEKEAEERLQAIEAERIKHVKIYPAHREFERRNNFDRSTEKDS